MSKKPTEIKFQVNLSPDRISEIRESILNSRQYRGLGIPVETVNDLINQSQSRETDERTIIKNVKQKMHNLVASYLGDPDYSAASKTLMMIDGKNSQLEINTWCLEILIKHASTRERIPVLEHFYKTLFDHTGIPKSVLDLACALNPFSIPWMGLDDKTEYFAYDLHTPRVDLINLFFRKTNIKGKAVTQDILVNPPNQRADVAFFFKEAHRFEQRQKGCNKDFWKAIDATHMLVSLPTTNLTGTHDKMGQQRRLVDETVKGTSWNVTEIIFENEIVFCIEKP
jgi:16S rRNA (guanine(1405)-N(7))-methyltransferase